MASGAEDDVMMRAQCSDGVKTACEDDDVCRCVVLVLSGIPGVGKSTLADAIRSRVATFTSSTTAAAAAAVDGGGGVDGSGQSDSVTTTPCSDVVVPSRVDVLRFDDYIHDPARSGAGPPLATAADTTTRTTADPATLECVSSGGGTHVVAGGAVGAAKGAQGSTAATTTTATSSSTLTTTFRNDRREIVNRVGIWLEAQQERPTGGDGNQSATGSRAASISTCNGGGVAHGKNVSRGYRLLVIDDNMYYTSMRYAVYQVVRAHCAGFATLMLQCDVETALERNAARNTAVVHPDVIRRMAVRIEPPRPDKHGCACLAHCFAQLSALHSHMGFRRGALLCHLTPPRELVTTTLCLNL
jgi:hypothetical protein